MSLKLGSKPIQAIYMPSTNSSAIIPSGIFDIPSRSGTYDVKSYAFARASFEDNLEKRLNGTLTSYSNSMASCIGLFAFAGTNISSVDLPAVRSVSTAAFYQCNQLSYITLPSCASIGTSAFMNCSNLISVNIPQCSVIGNGAFSNCTNLTTVSVPTTISYSIEQMAFCECTALTSFNFTKCTSIGYAVFSNCKSLSGTISFPTTISRISG